MPVHSSGVARGRPPYSGRGGMPRGSTTTPETSERGVGGVQRVVHRSVGCAADGAWRHRDLVRPRHPRTRDHVGGGGVEAPAAHLEGWHAAAVLHTVRGHRRLQRPYDGTEAEAIAGRGSRAIVGNAPPPG